MKKCILFLIVSFLLLFSLSVSASCNLDTTRWKWVASDSKKGVFYDAQTLKILNQRRNFVECWLCIYCPIGCSSFDGEHYHYYLNRIDYSSNTWGKKGVLVRNAEGNIIQNINLYDYFYEPIAPDTIMEHIALKIKTDYGL